MRKIEIDAGSFPSELQRYFAGGNIYDSSGHSGARVYFCDTGYYIKTDTKGELAEEAALGRFFHGKGLGVEVTAYISADQDYLVTKCAAGQDLTHFLDDPKKLCARLADALRMLHGQGIDGAPVSSRYRRYWDSANGDFSGGYYDESVRMDRFWISSKEEAWDILQANKNRLRADTLIHGDACLPNVIETGGKWETFIDFAMAGAGDRHIDLYWAIWSLQYNLKTDGYTDYFLDAYGRDAFDYEMLKVIAAFEVFG